MDGLLTAVTSRLATKAVSAGGYSNNLALLESSLIESLSNRRCRKVAPGNSQFELVASSVNTYSDSITADLQNKENGHAFSFKLQALKVCIRRTFIK